jgi:iron complex outermembrane receptor protein
MVVEEARQHTSIAEQTTASVTVIEIDKRISAGADLAGVVDSAAGTVVRRLGGLGDYSSVSIRGSSVQQVQVYLDGVPLNPDGSQSVNLSEFPISTFERVEVYRGNTPPQFAAAPIGGVVNLVTGERKEPTTATIAVGQHQMVRASGTVQRNTDWRKTPSDVLLLGEAFSTQSDFEYFTDSGTIYNTFDDAHRRRKNNDKAQLNTFGRWRLGTERLRLTVSDAFLFREEGVPGPISSTTTTPRLETKRNIVTTQADGRTDSVRWIARLWQQYRGETLNDQDGQIGAGNQESFNEYDTTGVMAHSDWTATSWLVPGATISVRKDRFKLTDQLTDTVADPRRRIALNASISTNSWAWKDQIQCTPVIQFSWFNNEHLGTVPFGDSALAPEDQKTIFSADPRIGVRVEPSSIDGLTLKANAGSYLRPPDFTELFGDRGGIIGNSALVPEEGSQWDGGVRYVNQTASLIQASTEATYFWKSAENQILLIQNSQRTSLPVNFGKTHTDGVELAITLNLGGWLDSQSTGTWTRTENRSASHDVNGKQLPGIPKWEAYQGTSVHWEDRVRLGHTYSYTAGNYWDAPNFFLAGPRAIHGLFVRGSHHNFSLEASILNVLNDTDVLMDRNPLSDQDNTSIVQPMTDFIGYPLPGRTWLLTMKWAA